MKIDLGILKLPFEGTFNMALFLGGVVWACFLVTMTFALVDMKGPAFYALNGSSTGGTDLCVVCRKPLFITMLWMMEYYNYVGAQVLCTLTRAAFEMFGKEDITDKFEPQVARWAGNMFEQSPVFLWSFWMYVLFVDYESGWALGALYMAARTLYPFYYIFGRGFSFWFENNTQIGYGCVGTFILGCLVNASGGNWARYGHGNEIYAGILGYLVGFALTLGIPYGQFLAFVHYKYDHSFKVREAPLPTGKMEMTNQ